MSTTSPPTDIEVVLEASARLDIAEVQLFRRAYRKWYGVGIDDVRLDRVFVAYMFGGVVPHWVRDYSRQVLTHARQHRLDPIEFGVLPVMRRRVRFGLGMLTLIALIFTLMVLVADWTLRWLPLKGCLLPPCY